MLEYTVAFTATPNRSPHTLFQAYAPTNQRVEIFGADVTLQGSTPASQPALFDWVIQTSAGTSTAADARLRDRGADETVQATLLKTFINTEPSGTTVISHFSVHQQGTFQWRPPIHWGALLVKGGERVGLRYNTSVFVDVVLTVYLQE